MSDLSITATAAGVGIGSAAIMAASASSVMRSPSAMATLGLVVGSSAGALAAFAVERHADTSASDRAENSPFAPNVAIPAVAGAALVGSIVYGSQRMFGSGAATGALALGAGIIGGAAATAAYNFAKGR